MTIRGHFRQKATQGKTYHLARCVTLHGKMHQITAHYASKHRTFCVKWAPNMMQNASSSVSFQHAICPRIHYNIDYQAIRKEPQNSRICIQGDYNLKQGEFSEGFCKRIFNTYPHPLPKGGGELTCKENHHCAMAFQAIATHRLTTKRAATLTSPQGRGELTCRKIIIVLWLSKP